MKKFDIVIIAGFIGALIFSDFTGVSRTLDSLQNDVLRMHILANSDSREDQELKLKVRDRLLECSEKIFGGADSLEEMKEKAKEKLDDINELVGQVIHENGYDYKSETMLVNMEFDEREYGEITMPAGNYDALRVTIGEAGGHNWWCVMYPPLCIPAAEKAEGDTDAAEKYFDSDQVDMMENPDDYEIRFKCIEVFRKIKDKLKI
ncbi:MAG: stage II sporulation protein R [Porcipelethomonas sp.]